MAKYIVLNPRGIQAGIHVITVMDNQLQEGDTLDSVALKVPAADIQHLLDKGFIGVE